MHGLQFVTAKCACVVTLSKTMAQKCHPSLPEQAQSSTDLCAHSFMLPHHTRVLRMFRASMLSFKGNNTQVAAPHFFL